MTPSTLAIFVVVPLLSFSFTYDISFFSATLPSQLPVLATLLLVSQRCSMQGTPSSSRMLHSLHRPTSVVIALAAATHRVAHAAYEKVTAESIANTRYNGTAVSINGSDIVIYLKNDGSSNVYFAFNGDYQFRLEKCPSEPAGISIEDHSCKWGVDWNDDYCIVQPNHSLWSIQFPEPKRRKIQNLMFRYDMDDERIVCEDRPGHSLEAKNVQELCMWTSALQGGHNVSAITVTNEKPSCPVKVIIVNAMLFATVPDATTLMGFVSDGMLNAEPESTTPSSGDDKALGTLEIVGIAVGGGLLLLLIALSIVMLVFFVCFPAKPKPKPKRDAEIEWPGVQAHLPYVDTTTEHVRFKASLGLFTFARCAKRERSKWVEALEPVVGDYGHIKAQTVDREGLPNRQPVHVYYSTAPERIEATGSRTATFAELAILARQASKGTAQGVLVVDVLVKHVSPPKQAQKQDLPKNSVFRRNPPPVDPTDHLSFLVTHALGPLLGAYLTEFDNNQLSLHDAAVYAHSSFEALRSLHQAGIVHRDVSPWAFVLEVDRPETLLMTHLSLARKIYDTKTKTFVRRRRRVNFFGTMQFGCRAAHAREERSFKDDVESWFYTICHLMWPGQTPWHNLRYDQATEAFEKDALHTEFSKLKEEFLRSFADTENPRNIHAPGPIFASIAEQILKSDYKTQTEEFAPELAQKLEAFAKEVPVASKEKQGKHPLPKLPLRPRCPTDKYLSDDKLPEAVRNGDPDDLYMH